ncbi:hypothetical protein [Propionivibrio sp.]|uniref:hypothetical protein n=1 Tax=Propionivibrio sp. TaxID=2212460 RepID=UPI003BF37E48
MTTNNAAVTASVKSASNDQDQEKVEWNAGVPIPIIASGITVIGAFGAAILMHVLANRREAVARIASAATEFRAAFAEELDILESNQKIQWLDKFLSVAYEAKHKAAISIFSHFVPEVSRVAFKTACEQYHSGHQKHGAGFSYESNFVEYITENPEENMRHIAAQRIRALLAFAKTK